MSQPNTSTSLNNSKPRGAHAIRKILVERFPVFRPKGTAKLPLKIGIYKDIRRAAPDLTAREVNKALAEYTRGPTYLGALIEGAPHRDLNGIPVDTVSAEQAYVARLQLSEIVNRMNEREIIKKAVAAARINERVARKTARAAQ